MVNVASSSLMRRVDPDPSPPRNLQLARRPVLLCNHHWNNSYLLTIRTLSRLSFPFFPPDIGNI